MAISKVRVDLSQKPLESGRHLSQEVTTWFHWYNRQRPHQSLNYRTPDEIYDESRW